MKVFQFQPFNSIRFLITNLFFTTSFSFPSSGECLSCYECPQSSSWSGCIANQEARYCEPGWRCVAMKEKYEGMNKYYFRRTCSKESVCSEFCKEKENCVYTCCNSNLCNVMEVWKLHGVEKEKQIKPVMLRNWKANCSQFRPLLCFELITAPIRQFAFSVLLRVKEHRTPQLFSSAYVLTLYL